MLSVITVPVQPFDDQKPGTSGLRKSVKQFAEPHYLETFVQALFDCLPDRLGQTLVLGGDGRFHNDVAIQTILKMAAANGFGRVIVGQGGILSTPAASHLIRLNGVFGGIILSASHNPGGPDGDFGIKFNGANGGPATETVTDAVFERSKVLSHYVTLDAGDVDLSAKGVGQLGDMAVEIVDPVTDYADLMETLFDFTAIAEMIRGGFRFRFDGMHAVTGPYAREVFGKRLGVPSAELLNCDPLPDFGGGHPDPNLVHAKHLFDAAMGPDGPDLCAASDGDGDRNLIIGKQCFVSPSDSLALIAANAHLAPGYTAGLAGVGRSMPTSGAVDRVAAAKGLTAHETPTGWKFFGNLLDAGVITLCGEESAGTGSSHVREKDGLWAILMWLNILAVRQEPVQAIMVDHWLTYGRTYYARHDYEGVAKDGAEALMAVLESRLDTLPGMGSEAGVIERADVFSYHDPIDGSVSNNQGIRLFFEGGARLVFRLSGTGTVGATVRVYLETYETPGGALDRSVNEALQDLAAAAGSIAGISHHLGRSTPDVVT
ncbi:MAG: alpha-D-glucose phosphate-specific phosphoglucomutase [Pseudomonadota bacterium]